MIITKPTCIPGNLTQALGTNNADVGAVCTNPNINIWAKYKPVRSSVIGELTEADKKTANYGMLFDYFKPAMKNYIVFPDGSRDTDDAYIAFSEGDKPWVKYLKPREGQTPKEWFRMFDFVAYGTDGNTKGYDTAALPPLRLTAIEGPYNITVGTTTQTYIVATFADNATNGNGLKYEDLKATDRPQATDITYEMKNMYLGFVLFYKPTWATLGQKWCIGAYEARANEQSIYSSPLKLSQIDGTTAREVKFNLTDKMPTRPVDINNAPAEQLEVYIRPVLYHADVHTGYDPGTIEWNGTIEPYSTERFLPLHTPSNDPLAVSLTPANKILVYADVTCTYQGQAAGKYQFKYTMNLRLMNCYKFPPSGTSDKWYNINDLRIRLYYTYEDWLNDQNYNEDLLQNIIDGNAPGTPLSPPMWQLTPYGGTGEYISRWRNNYEYFAGPDVFVMDPQDEGYMYYRYFRIVMEGGPGGGSVGPFDVVYQHGVFDDSQVEYDPNIEELE